MLYPRLGEPSPRGIWARLCDHSTWATSFGLDVVPPATLVKAWHALGHEPGTELEETPEHEEREYKFHGHAPSWIRKPSASNFLRTWSQGSPIERDRKHGCVGDSAFVTMPSMTVMNKREPFLTISYVMTLRPSLACR